MTTEQLLILGTIYIAPHMNPIYCHVMGSIFILSALCKTLGWL